MVSTVVKYITESVIDLGIVASIFLVNDIEFYNSFLKLATTVVIFMIAICRFYLFVKKAKNENEKDK